MKKLAFAFAAAAFVATPAAATTVSPTSGGALPAGITIVGGVVLDLIGSNDARVVSQLAASSLFDGTLNANFLTIGTQGGLTPAVTNALGGGLKELAVRITLDDGDNQPGGFDFNESFLGLNGTEIGNFSDVVTTTTNGLGVPTNGLNDGTGFGNNQLDTGFFFTNDQVELDAIFNSIVATEEVAFQLRDSDPDGNFLDFTQGLDGSLVDVGQGPTITRPGADVPVPAALPLLATALGGLAWMRRRRG